MLPRCETTLSFCPFIQLFATGPMMIVFTTKPCAIDSNNLRSITHTYSQLHVSGIVIAPTYSDVQYINEVCLRIEKLDRNSFVDVIKHSGIRILQIALVKVALIAKMISNPTLQPLGL